MILSISCASNKDPETSVHQQDRIFERSQNNTSSETTTSSFDVDSSPYPESVAIILPSFISRHPSSCNEIRISSLSDLQYIIEEIPSPPWASMRAAQCMLELYPEEGISIYIEWMNDSTTLGLAILVGNHIHEFPQSSLNTIFPYIKESPHIDRIKKSIIKEKSHLERELSDENLKILHSLN
jgi:hypothetical protein